MKTIIEMAQEAGIEWDLIDEAEGQIWYITQTGLEAFAKLVREDERAAIAAKNSPEIERLNQHIKNIEHQAARYAVVREWDFGGLNGDLDSPKSIDEAADDCIRNNA